MSHSRILVQSIGISACVASLVAVEALRAADTIVAMDCEPIPGLSRSYHNLRLSADINDNRVVAFADRNAIYTVDLDSPGTVNVIAQRGLSVGTNTFLSDFQNHVRINEHGCIAWLAKLSSTTNMDCYPLLDCGETLPGGPILCPSESNAIMRGGTCSTSLLFEQAQINPQEIYDFDVLENGNVTAALGIGFGPAEPPQIAILGPGSHVIYATNGDPAPEMSGVFDTGTPLPSAFRSVTSGVNEPVGFSADVENGATFIRTMASILNDTIVDCNAVANHTIGEYTNPVIDLGCTECFGDNADSVVHLVAIEDGVGTVCSSGAGHPTAYVETNTVSDTSRLLIEQGVPYATLGCGALCDMDRRASASIVTTVNSSCVIADGVAVFAGSYYPSGESCLDSIDAIFVCTGANRVYVLVEEGDRLPAPHSGRVFTSFGDPRVNSVGDVVFWAGHDVQCNDPLEDCGSVFAYDLNAFLSGLTDPCPADIDDDGMVGNSDLNTVLAAWGPCATFPCCADIDGTGTVDVNDLFQVLAAWGPCCP